MTKSCVNKAVLSVLSMSVALLTAKADYPSEVSGSGPLLYYRLGENVTTLPALPSVLNNGSSGAADNGVVKGYPSFQKPGAIAGDANMSVGFSGQAIDVPYDAALNTATFTVELWANPAAVDTSGARSPLYNRGAAVGGGDGWLFWANNGTTSWQFRTYNGTTRNTINSTAPAQAGVWTHLVGVYDGTKTHFYVNGVEQGTGIAAAMTLNTSLPLRMGGAGNDTGALGVNAWLGGVDEVAVYNTVLTPGVILSHYQNGTNAARGTAYDALVQASAPVGYWRLNESATYTAAVNAGTYGAAANGLYLGATNDVAGPQATAFPGFGGSNPCADFDGASGAVRIPANGTLSGASLSSVSEATFLCWFKRPGAMTGVQGLFGMRPPSTDLHIEANTLRYSWNDAGNTWGFVSGLTPTDNEWTMAAAVVRPSYAVLYMASASQGFLAVTNLDVSANPVTHSPANFTTGQFAIGDDPGLGGRIFVGSIDEPALYTKALSEGYLRSLYYTAIGSNAAPFMVIDPPGQSPTGTVYTTTTFSLNADVAGALPLTYQWVHEGTNLPGATSYTYTKANATLADAGNYVLVATNAYGSVTSQVATVTASPAVPVSITNQPSSRLVYAGGTASFSVGLDGTAPFTYQWKHAGTNLPGATDSSLFVSGVDATKTGNYSVHVANVAGSADSTTATLAIRTPTPNTFEAAIVGSGPIAYWRLGETSGTIAFDLAGGHDGTYYGGVTHVGGGLSGDANGAANFNGTDAYVGTGAGLLNGLTRYTMTGWIRRGGAQANRTGLFGQNDNVEFGYIDDQTIQCWDNVLGSGLNAANTLADGQWGMVTVTGDGANRVLYINGEPAGTAASRTSAFTNSFPFNIGGGGIFDTLSANGNWFLGDIDEVALFDKALSASDVANLYALGKYGTTTAPLVTRNPDSATAAVGTSVTFIGGIGGSLPLSYQWKKNGVNIPGATSQTLTLNNIFFTDAANYVLYGTNSNGFTNTVAATLTVLAQPSYANQTNDLVLHLRFDGDYLDTSGRTNDASAPAGSPGFVVGKLGQGVNINTTPGANYLQVSDLASDLSFDATASFTVALWLKYTTPFNDVPIIGNAVNSTYQPGWVLTEEGGRFEWTAVTVGGGASVIADPVSGTSPQINNGAWHHVAVAFDRSTGKAASYVDGARVATHSLGTLGTLINGATITIGQDPGGSYGTANFNLDDLGIWRRALTDYEVLSVYNAAQNSGVSFDTYGPFKVGIQAVGGNLYISYQGGTLYQADVVTGPYTPVAGASAPVFITTPSVSQKFYKVR